MKEIMDDMKKGKSREKRHADSGSGGGEDGGVGLVVQQTP